MSAVAFPDGGYGGAMLRRPRLTVAARDLWHLTGAAIDAGRVGEAQALADECVRISGWEPYIQGFTFGPRAIFYSPLLPPAWAYCGRQDDIACLLVHGGAALFVAQIRSLNLLFDAAERRGGGLLPLGELLGDVFVATVTPPDDASKLSA